jgi:ribosomal protein S18 acetylase RimI-like enzyme
MMSLMARVYRPATPAEVTPLAQALAAAFEHDPVWSWVLAKMPDRRRRLERFFALELEHVILPVGDAYTTDDHVGGCLVTPPDRWRLPISQQARQFPTFARILGRRLPRAFGLLTKMETKHLREPHYYVAYVGVAPAHQGQGIGAGLLAPALERADAERLPCFLEATSPDNARLYRRHGFADLETITFLGSPPLLLMRRDPA